MSNNPLRRLKTKAATQSKINFVQENSNKKDSNNANVRI